MKILCAPDSFKGTLTAPRVAAAMVAGARAAGAAALALPVADGGEGTLDVLVDGHGGRRERRRVCGPLGAPLEADFGIAADGRTGIVELAAASGLALLDASQRDPTRTTTYGTGQLIRAALDAGCAEVIVGIGGSATCDGAAGLAQALGVRFLDAEGRAITEPLTGGMLLSVARIERPSHTPALRVACDVTNPLCGPDGAAAVYGPQKGATLEQVRRLDAALAHLARVSGGDATLPGAGAAGGAGFGLVTLLGAQLERGVDLVLDAIGFDEACTGCDLVITGEGCLDAQTLNGKACMGVALAARRVGTPTVAIVGCTGEGWERRGLFSRVVDLSATYGRDRARGETALVVEEAVNEVVRR